MGRRQSLPTVADIPASMTIEEIEEEAALIAQELVDMTNQNNDPSFRVRSKAELHRRDKTEAQNNAMLAAYDQRIDQLTAEGGEDETALRLRLMIGYKE